jgi:hypothetical protein
MKALTIKPSKFRLKKFLDALHRFSPDGNPLPGVSGDIVHHDSIDLAEDLSSDVDEEFGEIPADSLARLEMGVPIFGYFALFDGDTSFNCIDGQQVEIPNLDEEDEDEEPLMPRRPLTQKFRSQIENTPCDENTCFGFVISLTGGKVEIEGKAMNDFDGDSELEMMVEPNLLCEAMRRWVRSFTIKRGGKR